MRKSTPTSVSRGSPLVVRPLLAALAAAGLAMPLTAPAATIAVNSNADPGTASTCTLRQAIASINAASLQGNCAKTGNFGTSDEVDLTLRTGTITLSAGEIPITQPVTLNGPVAGPTVLTISGNNASRVLSVTGGSSITINRLTIANGKAAGSGGCILSGVRNAGPAVVALNTSIVKSCVAAPVTTPANPDEIGVGGGIAAPVVLLFQSTVSGNTSIAGGGVFAKYAGSFGSSINGNTVTAQTCNVGDTSAKYSSCIAGVFGGGGVLAGLMYSEYSTIAGNTVNASTITIGTSNPTTGRIALGGGISTLYTSSSSPVVAGAARAARSKLVEDGTLAGKAGLAGKAARLANVGPGGKYGSTLINTTVSGNTLAGPGSVDNQSKYAGGGVFALAVLTSNTTISANSATPGGFGGGIAGTAMTLKNSTIAGNTGIGGVAAFPNNMSPVSSPLLSAIKAPVARLVGAPSQVDPPLSPLELRSTLIANNTGVVDSDIECPQDNCTFTGNTSLVRSVGSGVTVPPDTIVDEDPLLGPLAANGGFVTGAPGGPGTATIKTMLPQLSSPAIDAGSNPDNLKFDERGEGFPRVLGDRADIGATEVGGTAVQVPTLAAWPLAALSALLGALGWRARRRLR